MTVLTFLVGWLALLTIAAIYFVLRGNHQRSVINYNGRALNTLGEHLNANVDKANANFRLSRGKIENLEANARHQLDVNNENADTANENFRDMKKRMLSLRDMLDARFRRQAGWLVRVEDQVDLLAKTCEDADVALALAAQEASHGVDAVDSRLTNVRGDVYAELDKLRAACTLIVDHLRSDPGAFDYAKLANSIEAALGSFPETTAGVSDLPKEIATKYGSAFLVPDTNVYSRPKPDGEKGNYFFTRDGEEIQPGDVIERTVLVVDDPEFGEVYENDEPVVAAEHTVVSGRTDANDCYRNRTAVSEEPVSKNLPTNDPAPGEMIETPLGAAHNRAYFTRVFGSTSFGNLRDGVYVCIDKDVEFALAFFNSDGVRLTEEEATLSDPPVTYNPPTGANAEISPAAELKPLTDKELDMMF